MADDELSPEALEQGLARLRELIAEDAAKARQPGVAPPLPGPPFLGSLPYEALSDDEQATWD